MQKTNLIHTGLVFLTVLVISGCLSGESNVESGNRESILHFGNYGEPTGLDPHVAGGVPARRIVGALFEGLVRKDPVTLVPRPGVAESWTLSDDLRTYTFTIRSNARWSNGDELTAHDFAWSWWRALQPTLASPYVYMFFPIKNAERYYQGKLTDFSKVGIRALNDRTLQVELTNPAPHFLQLLDYRSMYPVHRATIEAFGRPDESYTRWTRPGNMVSNGPFKLEEWRMFHILKVERNEYYWDNKNVSLNGVHFHPVDKQATEERMFRAGQLHRTEDVPIEKIDWYRIRHPDLIRIEPFFATYFYRINSNAPELSDIRVRRALALSIDRKKLITTVLNDVYTPAFAVTPPGLLGYQPPKLHDYNPGKARQLLREAGFPEGKEFPKLELKSNTHEQHRMISIAMQKMWKDNLNIDVSVRSQDWNSYLNDIESGNYQISRASWMGDYVDPNTFLDMWITEGSMNKTGFSSVKYDQLVMEKAPTTRSLSKRLELLHKAERILMEQAVVLPLYTYSTKHLVHPTVKGMAPNYMDYVSFRDISLVQSKMIPIRVGGS